MTYTKPRKFDEDLTLSILTMHVLSCFFKPGRRDVCGADIMAEIDILSSSMYPILQRLEDGGWLVSRWEEEAVPRQKRRFYKLTTDGRRAFIRVIRHLHSRVSRKTK